MTCTTATRSSCCSRPCGPDLQTEGINAVMMDHVCQSCNRHGVRFAETGPMLEKNDHILAQWKRLDKEQHKRRRCFIKDLNHDVNGGQCAAAAAEEAAVRAIRTDSNAQRAGSYEPARCCPQIRKDAAGSSVFSACQRTS